MMRVVRLSSNKVTYLRVQQFLSVRMSNARCPGIPYVFLALEPPDLSSNQVKRITDQSVISV